MGLLILPFRRSRKVLKISKVSSESATLPESCSSCIWAEMFGEIMLSPSVESNVIFEEFDSSILKKNIRYNPYKLLSAASL